MAPNTVIFPAGMTQPMQPRPKIYVQALTFSIIVDNFLNVLSFEGPNARPKSETRIPQKLCI